LAFKLQENYWSPVQHKYLKIHICIPRKTGRGYKYLNKYKSGIFNCIFETKLSRFWLVLSFFVLCFCWGQFSLLNTGCAKTFSQDKDAHICYSPNLENRIWRHTCIISSFMENHAFIYFCYSILTTLWNKVISNFDPAYFLLVISCSDYFSQHFSPVFLRFHHRVSMNGDIR
jgi:hypothetical protein